MKDIELRFIVAGELSITGATRDTLFQHYEIVPASTVSKFWKGSIPAREKLSINVAGTCVSFMDDWECRIFGKSYLKCISALSVIQTFLVNNLGNTVSFQMLSPADWGEIKELISNEGRQSFLVQLVWLVAGAVLGAGISILASVLIN